MGRRDSRIAVFVLMEFVREKAIIFILGFLGLLLLVWFVFQVNAIDVSTRNVVGTMQSVRDAGKEFISSYYLQVQLVDGSLVDVEVPNRAQFEPGKKVLLLEAVDNTTSEREYTWLRLLTEQDMPDQKPE